MKKNQIFFIKLKVSNICSIFKKHIDSPSTPYLRKYIVGYKAVEQTPELQSESKKCKSYYSVFPIVDIYRFLESFSYLIESFA